MQTISIQNDYHKIVVDDIDYNVVNRYFWFLSPNNTIYANVNGTITSLGRFILGPSSLPEVDHKDRNIFNNWRDNLRNCDKFQNMANAGPHSDASSHYKGITKDINRNKWIARICVKGKNIFIGRFETEDAAAKAYNVIALKYNAEFAYINNVTI